MTSNSLKTISISDILLFFIAEIKKNFELPESIADCMPFRAVSQT